jgi:hypothetical protein
MAYDRNFIRAANIDPSVKQALETFMDDLDAFNPLSAAEIAYLDGSSPGVATDSKTAVYDSAGKLFASSATPAAAGTLISDATVLTAMFNAVTGANGTAGVKLPVAAADEVVVIINTNASNALLVYPVSASQINALGASNAFTITAGQMAIFMGRSATLWYVAAATDTISGLTASATELNQLASSAAANTTTGKAAILGTNGALALGGKLSSAVNVGTAGTNCTAVHYGDGVNMTAVVTVTNAVIVVGNSADLGVGYLVYNLPAGACMIRDSYYSMVLSGITTSTDTPDTGLGTVIASGVVTVLDGTATFENISTGIAMTNPNSTPTVSALGPTAGGALPILTGAAHTVHFNMAGAWSANADASGLLNGTVVISYVRQAA